MASILVTSLVSSSTHMPRIEIEMEKPRVQLSRLEAIDLAMNILQCVNGASADAFIFDWCKQRLPNCSDADAGQLLIDFRNFRDEIDKRERNS